MTTLLLAPVLVVAFCIGLVSGLAGGYLTHAESPPKVTVLYCKSTSTDPRCVDARERLKVLDAAGTASASVARPLSDARLTTR